MVLKIDFQVSIRSDKRPIWRELHTSINICRYHSLVLKWNAPLMWLENISPEDICIRATYYLESREGFLSCHTCRDMHPRFLPSETFATSSGCCIVWMSHGPKSAYLPASSWRGRVLHFGRGLRQCGYWDDWLIDWLSRVLRRIGKMAEVLKNDV